MKDIDRTIADLGNESPLVADGRNGPPDRREVSARWLSGTFLTGITSSILMGVALVAALDGREQLATPPEVLNLASLNEASSELAESAKAGRLTISPTVNTARDRRRMEVSTVTREGDRDVVRTLPFVHVDMALAAGHTTNRDYPSFDPMAVFAEQDEEQISTHTGIIYGAKVESEISLRTVDFPIATASYGQSAGLSADEVERVVRSTGAILTEGDVQVAALHYVDPQRFGDALASQPFDNSFARIFQENVSVAPRRSNNGQSYNYVENVIPFLAEQTLKDAFFEAGHEDQDGERMADALASLLNTDRLAPGHYARLGLVVQDNVMRMVRASIYDRRDHVLTIALNDRNQFVPASEPEPNPAVMAILNSGQPIISDHSNLPTAYDGIYRAALSYGLTERMTRRLIRLLASEVDFQSRISPSDQLEVFFSQPNAKDRATEASELLYVNATFGGETRTFYRYQMEDGTVDYFDEDGRSAQPFLIRNPLPKGRFTSGFGMRRHPILGYSRMHSGVDWAAPRGTPIIAAGDGTVVEAGWSSGYGRHTVIRHGNGYATTYSHQNAIANGVTPGATVRQGQVIGYVGSTGMSTGNHLHYEVHVNNNPVDPMRVRLPNSRALEDDELIAFKNERNRIRALLDDEPGSLSLAHARYGSDG